MKSAYLLINFFTILIPFLWSFESRIQFYQKWKFVFPSIVLPAVLFLIWDYFKTRYGVWGFNPDYITGYKMAGLPIEEIFFFFLRALFLHFYL
ncbi:MAG: lycopene cyclase domain-containing protein [Bacteroidetes bacterium]|nr:lycopene cyclase domain-containing protein [Bacteroidota bacterium]